MALGAATYVVGEPMLIGKSEASSPSPAPLPERTAPLAAFLDSVGICAHLSDTGSSYRDLGAALAQLRMLGVSHIRDDVRGGFDRQGQILQATRARGIRTTLVVTPTRLPVNGQSLDWIAANKDAFDAIEGPNEIDNTHVPMAFEPEGRKLYGGALEYMSALSSALKQRGIGLPVLSFTIVRDNLAAQVAQLEEQTAPFDIEAVHLYDKDGAGPAIGLSAGIAQFRRLRSKPFIITETGYTTLRWTPQNDRKGGRMGVSDRVQGLYLARTLLDAFALGARRTFLYQLQDGVADPTDQEKEAHFGLFDINGKPKESARTIAALLGALRSAAQSGARAGDRMFAQPAQGVRSLRLTWGDGHELLLLWRTDSLWDASSHAERTNAFGGQDVHLHWSQAGQRRIVTRDVSISQSVTTRANGTDTVIKLGPAPLIVMSYRDA